MNHIYLDVVNPEHAYIEETIGNEACQVVGDVVEVEANNAERNTS